MKTILVVQARMGSSRLPGKTMLVVNGKTVIRHMLERLKRCRSVDRVVLSVPESAKDKVLIDQAIKLDIEYFAGSELDVLDRFYQTSARYAPAHVVRCTGDCPLIDPHIVDNIVKAHIHNNNDYTSNALIKSYPYGFEVEVIRFETLAVTADEAKEAYEREHVTPFVYQHPKRFKVQNILADKKHHRPDLRLCVDTKEDFELVSRVFAKLDTGSNHFSIEDVIDLINHHTDWIKINSHIKQKTLSN